MLVPPDSGALYKPRRAEWSKANLWSGGTSCVYCRLKASMLDRLWLNLPPTPPIAYIVRFTTTTPSRVRGADMGTFVVQVFVEGSYVSRVLKKPELVPPPRA